MRRLLLIISWALIGLLSPPLLGANLEPATVAAFNSYIVGAEAQSDKDLRSDCCFLFIDHLQDEPRTEAYAQLKQGTLRIKAVGAGEYGQPNSIPNGMIHDWVGVVFIPGATMAETLSVLQNYNNYAVIYKPSIQKSVLLDHDGNEYKTFMTLHNKSIVTVVLHANFDVDFNRYGDTRALSRSYSRRIAEVRNPGQPSEHELPVGQDRGYVWRLYSYWRIEQKDGGIYLQTEVIELSRTVPSIYAFLVRPLIVSIPRTYLANILTATRSAIVSDTAYPNHKNREEPGAGSALSYKLAHD